MALKSYGPHSAYKHIFKIGAFQHYYRTNLMNVMLRTWYMHIYIDTKLYIYFLYNL